MTKVVLVSTVLLILSVGWFIYHEQQGVVECANGCALEFMPTYRIASADATMPEATTVEQPIITGNDPGGRDYPPPPEPIATYPPGGNDDCPIGQKCIMPPPPIK